MGRLGEDFIPLSERSRKDTFWLAANSCTSCAFCFLKRYPWPKLRFFKTARGDYAFAGSSLDSGRLLPESEAGHSDSFALHKPLLTWLCSGGGEAIIRVKRSERQVADHHARPGCNVIATIPHAEV